MADRNITAHYYGDIVRKLFMAAGFVMLITLPFVNNRLPISFNVAILVIMAIDIFAAFTNPLWKWVAGVDTAISLAGFLFYSYYTVAIYQQHSVYDILFWTDLTLGIIFFFALYFSSKTFRGIFAQ